MAKAFAGPRGRARSTFFVVAGSGDRRARLRAAAIASGVAGAVPARAVGATRRRRIIESTRGLGAQVDRLIDEERDRV
jgi:hypothetical protein